MDNTIRFSDRVDNYKRFRPNYPKEAIDFLFQTAGLAGKIIADIGSGTGILTEHLLDRGNTVYAIEPNDNMRLQSEMAFSNISNFRSINATAENTTLPHQSIDFITCAQAFHWFDLPSAKIEFSRIVRHNKLNVAILYNRRTIISGFEKEYENVLLENIPDYLKNNHHKINDSVYSTFFTSYSKHFFPNNQIFDLDGFLGRVFSSSYTPKPSDVHYNHFYKILQKLFNKYEINSHITFNYDTEIVLGLL